MNGIESSNWRSGSVQDWDASGHGFKTKQLRIYVLLYFCFLLFSI